MKDIKVSVIIPVYNAEQYIKQCLASALEQTLSDIEVICVDDGSTDSSLALLKEMQEQDARIKIYTQSNSGSGAARNHGLNEAHGKYVSFLDADDCYPSGDVLHNLYSNAEEHHVKICGGGISFATDGVVISGREFGNGRTFDNENYFATPGITRYADVQGDYGYQRYLYLKSLLDENNIRFPDYLRFQDPPFFVKAMVSAGTFYAVEEDTYCYRMGHKPNIWTQRKTCDLLKGLLDLLVISGSNGLYKLHHRVGDYRINRECLGIIAGSLAEGNLELLELLIQFQRAINIDYLNKIEPGHYKSDYMISPLQGVLDLNALLRAEERIKEVSAQAEERIRAVSAEKEQLRCQLQWEIDVLKNEVSDLKREIYNIHQTKSYRIGRAVTYIPRKIRGGIQDHQDPD